MLIRHALQQKGGVVPPTGVVLSAISLIPSAHLISGKLGWADTPFLVTSFWVRGFMGNTTHKADQPWSWAVKDIICSGNELGVLGGAVGSENIPGYDFCCDNAGGTWGTLRSNKNNDWIGASAPNNNGAAYNSNTPVTSGQQDYQLFQRINGIWVNFLNIADFSTPANPLDSWYMNGVQVNVAGSVVGGSPFTAPFSPYIGQNPRGIGIGNDSGNGGCSQFDIAQVLMDAGADLPSNPYGWLNSAGVAPDALVQRFYKSGPVDFGADGSGVLGLSRKPGLYLNGDKTGFLTNKGSSAAAWSIAASQITSTATAPMTASPAIYDCPVGPGAAPPAYPYLKWQGQGSSNGVSSDPDWQELATGTQTQCTVSSYCQLIEAGDTILVLLATTDNNSNINHAIQTPAANTPSAGWNWTAVNGFPAFMPTNGPGYGMNIAAFTAVAPSTLAAGTELDFAVLFTANSQLVGMRWVMLNLGKSVGSIVGTCDTSVTTARAAVTTPSVVVTSATVAKPAMCLDIAVIWQPPPTLPESIMPAGNRKIAGAFAGEATRRTDLNISSRPITATGATVSKTITQEQVIPALGATIVIQP